MSLDSTAISILEAKYRRSAHSLSQPEINSVKYLTETQLFIWPVWWELGMPAKFFPQVRLRASAWSILGDPAETPPTASGRSPGRRGRPRLRTPVPSSFQRPAAHGSHGSPARPPRLPATIPAPQRAARRPPIRDPRLQPPPGRARRLT